MGHHGRICFVVMEHFYSIYTASTRLDLTCRFPREVLPDYFGDAKGLMRFRVLCLVLTTISTLLGFLQPVSESDKTISI